MRPPTLIAALALACSSPTTPAPPDPTPRDQVIYVERWRAIKGTWLANEGNDLRRRENEDQARALFTQKRVVRGWIGDVRKVNAGVLGSIWVDTELRGMTFELWASGEDVAKWQPVFRTLNIGDRVTFDGTIEGEMSMTAGGAMREPEIRIAPTRVDPVR